MVAVSQWKSQEWHWNLLQVSYLTSAALQHFSMCALLPSHTEREDLSVRWLALWQEGSEHACHCSRPNKVMLMSHGKSEIQDCVQLLPQEIKPPEEIKPQQLTCPMLGRGIQVPTCKQHHTTTYLHNYSLLTHTAFSTKFELAWIRDF